ncbi:MAG: YggT family protein [Actinomycetota bacterium]|nr:YggT family protein [Actinomycetota bacterium]
MELVCAALGVYWLVLLARIILSWVQVAGARTPSTMGPVVKVVYDLTEPVLGFFRRIIPPFGMLDLSPLIVFLILGFIRRALGCTGIF